MQPVKRLNIRLLRLLKFGVRHGEEPYDADITIFVRSLRDYGDDGLIEIEIARANASPGAEPACHGLGDFVAFDSFFHFKLYELISKLWLCKDPLSPIGFNAICDKYCLRQNSGAAPLRLGFHTES